MSSVKTVVNCELVGVMGCEPLRLIRRKSSRMVQGDSGQGVCRPRHHEDKQSVNLSMSFMANFTAADPLRIYFD